MVFYAPIGKYIWDSWLIKVKNTYHLFYLQADNSISPENRHDFASIGHAVSKDIIVWKDLGTALKPGKEGSWDDLCIWTGNTIKKDDSYFMFYTGRGKKQPLKQGIGVAISKDLVKWRRNSFSEIIEPDDNYDLRLMKNKWGNPPAWRDPYVFRDPLSNKYYMTISARAKNKEMKWNGCIGFAVSEDMNKWELKKPILNPQIFDEMETSQILFVEGKYYIFFSSYLKKLGNSYSNKKKLSSGLYCYFSQNIEGPYLPANENGLVLEYGDFLFSVQIIRNSLKNRKKDFLALGWLYLDKKGNFVGKLSQLFTININGSKVKSSVNSYQLMYVDDSEDEEL